MERVIVLTYNRSDCSPTSFRKDSSPMRNTAPRDTSELEAIEQREWRESLDYVIQQGDRGRVQRLLDAVRQRARTAGVSLPFTAVTPYVNTIRVEDQVPLPGN